MSTRGSGVYKVYWDGVDDAGRAVTPGRYVLHVETSRERGGHTHRTIEGDFSRAREFALELPVILWSDVLIWLLVLAAIVLGVLSSRNPPLRAAWQRVGRSRPGMAAATVLMAFVD